MEVSKALSTFHYYYLNLYYGTWDVFEICVSCAMVSQSLCSHLCAQPLINIHIDSAASRQNIFDTDKCWFVVADTSTMLILNFILFSSCIIQIITESVQCHKDYWIYIQGDQKVGIHYVVALHSLAHYLSGIYFTSLHNYQQKGFQVIVMIEFLKHNMPPINYKC